MSDLKRKDDRGRVLKEGESQRSDGRYQYQYTGLDKKRHSVYSWRLLPSDKVPEGVRKCQSLREKEKEVQKKLLEEAEKRSVNIILNEMFDIYIQNKKYRGKALSPNTIRNYNAMYNKHIRESYLGKMKVQDIKKSHIVEFYISLQKDSLSYGTITFYQKVLSAVFNMAIDEEIIDKNPTIRALNQIEGCHKEKHALSVKEQEALLSYAKKYDPDMYRKLVFLIDSMCRVCEFAGVTWDDINMKEKIISINHQLQYKKYSGDDCIRFRIAPTKGRNERYIPMTNRLYRVLKEMKSNYFINRREDLTVDNLKDFVFLSKNGKLICTNAFRTDLLRLLDSYNMKNPKNRIEYLSPHILRHSGCTRNAENGMDMKVLQYLMGHKSPSITNQVYNHITEERVMEEMLKAARNQQKQA
ncbi:MAG: tyrosine-type recombinase/integrase [Lachnospiraceae bacterium]